MLEDRGQLGSDRLQIGESAPRFGLDGGGLRSDETGAGIDDGLRDWPLVVKRVGLAVTFLVAASLIVMAGNAFLNRRSSAPEEPRREERFFGVDLGATREDVLFVKGDAFSITPPGTGVDPQEMWKYGVDTDDVLHYSESFPTTDYVGNETVSFREYRIAIHSNRVWLIACVAGCADAEKINGIGVGTSLALLEQWLGQPSRFTESENHLQRLYLWERYNMALLLRRGEVLTYGIYDPEQQEPTIDHLSITPFPR